MPRLPCQLIAVAGGTRKRIAHSAGGYYHLRRAEESSVLGEHAHKGAVLKHKLFRPAFFRCYVLVLYKDLKRVGNIHCSVRFWKDPSSPLRF